MGDNYFLIDPTGNAIEVVGELKIGRNKTNQLVVSDPLASRHHATVYLDGDVLMVRDENSINGTFVNNKQIYEPTSLNENDKIQIGDEVFVVRAPLSEARTVMASEEEKATVLVGKDKEEDKSEIDLKDTPTFIEDDPDQGNETPSRSRGFTIMIIALAVVVMCICCGVIAAAWFFAVNTTIRVIESGTAPIFEWVTAFIPGL
ncbi:MAG: FHA domain-containing protein [Anaerolineales bacterium]